MRLSISVYSKYCSKAFRTLTLRTDVSSSSSLSAAASASSPSQTPPEQVCVCVCVCKKFVSAFMRLYVSACICGTSHCFCVLSSCPILVGLWQHMSHSQHSLHPCHLVSCLYCSKAPGTSLLPSHILSSCVTSYLAACAKCACQCPHASQQVPGLDWRPRKRRPSTSLPAHPLLGSLSYNAERGHIEQCMHGRMPRARILSKAYAVTG